MSERRGSSCAAMGAVARRGSVGCGGRRSQVDQKGAMFMQIVETRVTVIEQSIEAQDASLQHITASLQLLAAALEVQLPPPKAGWACFKQLPATKPNAKMYH